MGGKTVIGDAEAVAIRRQWEREVLPRVDSDSRALALVQEAFQRVSEGRYGVEPSLRFDPKRNLAQAERDWWWTFYRERGLGSFEIPLPGMLDPKDRKGTRFVPASNRLFRRWQESGSGLIWVPETTREFYERFMSASAVGQKDHWTVTGANRNKIVWDDLSPGWRRVEQTLVCPRLNTPWDALNSTVKLLALLEYAVAWHGFRARNHGEMLDMRTVCWLRTRYNYGEGRLGALLAYECDGRVFVYDWLPEDLSVPDPHYGGRAAEVVPIAA